ncbi:alpha mannosidase-like protein [Dendrothele bispora CBS 962.96]|uniref:alpha-1,2-Mannosidase n=1 Tax=Dendrothele bispora (strain CBS 962.96) TaxID=1314807 RepID=A0A4S8N0P1_DENBC|nr:alpha mannosidase-like protein [Dendrothele bispora CBS 962.96]
MKWGRYLPESLAVLVVIALEGIDWAYSTSLSNSIPQLAPWTPERKLAARERTRELWYHGFNSYMRYAFPLDELTPLSCSGQGPNWSNPAHISVNDVAGNFSLTLIDVLDTFVVLNDTKGFDSAVRNVIDWVSFDVNTKPQVFETTIRVLGGLLSGHIFANQTGPFHLPWYRSELLDLAHDLGKRLLPAFATPTGIPYARVNLRHGLMRGESLETCTAGAGSLILEFATLSRLTGDGRFEKAAYKAFFALWNRKSDIGLVGNTINTWTGDWTSPETTGIGAGIDSFYEYALKWYIMSGEVEFLDVWDEAYAAVMRYSRSMDGFWYKLVNMRSGDVAYNTVDSLSAFWPGLQVLAGDIQGAIKLHLLYYNLWRRHSGLPEVYDTSFKVATSHAYPLRPEFIESTWYLYRATRDPFYLDVGERVLSDLMTRAKVDCGLAGIEDLRTNKRDDRMESFALSETLKYLSLLFDEENPLHRDDSNYVFTTEGHLLTLGKEHLKPLSPARQKLRKLETHQCPAYQPFILSDGNASKETGLIQGIPGRTDVDYTRELVALDPSDADSMYWSPSGWCERPKIELFSYDFILSPHGKNAKEDLSPSLIKLAPARDGFIINNVTGVRTHIVRRLDGKGYDIRKVGHYTVRPGQVVYINDTSLFPDASATQQVLEEIRLPSDVQLRFYVDIVDPMFNVVDTMDSVNDMEVAVTGYSAFFGADLSATHDHEKPIRFSGLSPVYRDENNLFGCTPFARSYQDGILVVSRGDCTFLQKLTVARDAGAAGVLVISDDNTLLNPTADAAELAAAGDISDVAIVVLPLHAGQLVEQLLASVDESGLGQLMLSLEHERQPAVGDSGDIPEDRTPTRTEPEKEVHRILYLNGLPLLNTRLLV